MDEVKVCVDGHIIYIIYMSYYNSQDLAHTADSAGKPEVDFCYENFRTYTANGSRYRISIHKPLLL